MQWKKTQNEKSEFLIHVTWINLKTLDKVKKASFKKNTHGMIAFI